MKTNLMCCAAMLGVAGVAVEVSAQTYSYMLETGDILATMELIGPGPFDHTDVVDFSFTAEGDAIFGLGVGSFAEPFIETNNGLFDDLDGTLFGTGVFIGTAFTDFVGGPQGDLLEVVFSSSSEPTSTIGLVIDGGAQRIRVTDGMWVIPAPGAAALFGFAGLMSSRRRR